MTTRQTVSGVASTSPGAPQSHVQKTAATMRAMAETPVLDPYSIGSITLLLSSSITTKSATVRRKGVQLVEAAIERMSGKAEAIHAPTYGMNRRTVASTPHTKGLGTPMK